MNGHASVSTHTAPRTVRKAKSRKKAGRPRTSSNGHKNGEHAMAAAGTLTRTKSLLLAALRVWELKHRIGE
jgi:Flp pilus assembly protein TadD